MKIWTAQVQILTLVLALLLPTAAFATPCADDSECGSFELCISGECTEVSPTGDSCESDMDCLDGYCLDSWCYAPADPTHPIPGDCTSDADCASGETCMDGYCMGSETRTCMSDDDCAAGETCMEGYCSGGEIPSCTSDADCSEGEVCMDGYCSYDGGTAYTDCSTDADCADGSYCIWSYCLPSSEGFCKSDADCGSGQVCQGCYCEDAGGTCASDADCGELERCETVEVGTATAEGGGSEPSDPGQSQWEDTCTYTRGYCLVDFASVPEDPRCAAFCTAVMACEPSGDEGTTDGGQGTGTDGDTGRAQSALESDEQIECIQYCSYELGVDSSQTEMAALVDCVSANADSCDTMMDQCSDEYETLAPEMEDDVVSVDAKTPTSGGTTQPDPDGAPETGSEKQTAAQNSPFAALFGGSGTGTGGTGNNPIKDAAENCSTASTTAVPGFAILLLAVLVGLGYSTRRRTVR